MVHEVEVQVRDIVTDLPPLFQAFYESDEARTCPNCGALHPGKGVTSMSSAVVDVHTHVVPNGWPDLAVVTGSDGWPWLRIDSERAAMIMVGEGEFRPIGCACWSAADRLADMDADGIDRQVVSPTPLFFGYERDAGEAVKVARIFNDLTLECVADGGDRLIPFCQVPLQDPDAACAELDRCLAAGHAGVEIGNHVGERDLDDDGVVAVPRSTAPTSAPRCSSTRGTCRPGRASTAGWPAGCRGCPPRRTCRCWR